MAKKNNTKSKAKVIEPDVKTEDIIVDKEEVIDNVNDTEGSVMYEIMLATPYYFIINKDGKNIVIKKINNYKKGDMISL